MEVQLRKGNENSNTGEQRKKGIKINYNPCALLGNQDASLQK